ncbi:hormone-sensitive lipase isoform X2 [Rhodnius prolixus]|uniref:hormone-sensitive lipase isoform X2 n=1 Tax=Rhodnius prolixus TaxID=13249 RepID=UPI003D18EA06
MTGPDIIALSTWPETVSELRDLAEDNVKFFGKEKNDSLKASGYRSFLNIVEIVACKTKNVAKDISTNRVSYFFRRDYYLKEITAYADTLKSLTVLMQYMKTLLDSCENGMLFPTDGHTLEEIVSSIDDGFSQTCFYGRCLGIQFCDSMATVLRALCTLMASFSEMYYCDGRIIDPLVKCSKYLIDPELRAKRIVNISRYASAEFCKNFWFLGEMELMQRLPSIVSPSLAVNRLIVLQPQPLTLPNNNGKVVDIPVPSAQIGSAPLSVRLISASSRLGMENCQAGTSGIKFPSPNLVIHCHGGGFVAQSSRSHETYLRQWALALDCPILSIDYSLAPEAPYPRALEEAFYAYCWALENVTLLGATGERIILAGDSAGANINIGVTMMSIDYGVRQPDGLFLAYVPVILSFAPSPSRLLCVMDPLLPFGFLMGCSKAYACSPEVYARSTIHERKLRSNDASGNQRNGFDNVLNGTAVAEEESEAGNMSERPALCTLKEEKTNSGILSRMFSSLSNKFTYLSYSKYKPDDESVEDEDIEETLLCPKDMLNFEIPKDPYISPYYAGDEVLSKFPPVTILTTELDPFLDDCIEFAKKLRRVGNSVKLVVLPGLSHGFLNFSMLSNEAYEGSKICIQCINELLQGEKGEECL